MASAQVDQTRHMQEFAKLEPCQSGDCCNIIHCLPFTLAPKYHPVPWMVWYELTHTV